MVGPGGLFDNLARVGAVCLGGGRGVRSGGGGGSFLGGKPVDGQEFGDAFGGVALDAGEDIDKVGVGVGTDGAAALDEAQEHPGGIAADLATDEKPVFATDGQGAQGAFGHAVVGLEAGVGEEGFDGVADGAKGRVACGCDFSYAITIVYAFRFVK